jgi:putative hydrolase of the HAD superfamily
MFRELLCHFGVEPERVIHVGDSVSDVLGAKRAGIAACWLNRTGREWQLPGSEPDFTIRRLDELFAVLEA